MKKFIQIILGIGIALPVMAADTLPPANIPVSNEPIHRTLRDVSLDDIVFLKMETGLYKGSEKTQKNFEAYDKAFYATLASEKVYKNKEKTEWDNVPIPQYTPPPCDQPQYTEYDADTCRIVNSLFKDEEKVSPEKAKKHRDMVRKGRDVWFKGTFGTQDLYNLQLTRLFGKMPNYGFLDTRRRNDRFKEYGLINDPDCKQGSEKTYWMDDCRDPHSSGVLGLRKYWAQKSEGFDPRTAPYQAGELAVQKRFVFAHSCVICHVAFDPTNPPKDPTAPKWSNLMGFIGNQYISQTGFFAKETFTADNMLYQTLIAQPEGTSDTSLVASDYRHNPNTINQIADFHNRRLFVHTMKDPYTGELKKAKTRHILKGGEDSVGDVIALLRVYVNIGLCSEECWVGNFAKPGAMFGYEAAQRPFNWKTCAEKCEPWNWADAKMGYLASFAFTSGPTYLAAATDVDGTPGSKYIDYSLVPKGKEVYAAECARCHSTRVPPEAIKNDKDALKAFYKGHVFGREPDAAKEFTAEFRNSAEFKKYVDAQSGRFTQFAKADVFGQDWLGNDELTAYNDVGTYRCRATHDNHHTGHIFEEFSSETYKQHKGPGNLTATVNPLLPLRGGKESVLGAEEKIEGGNGYYRNVSILSAWASAPYFHNNALGSLRRLPDGNYDYTVKGRIAVYEDAMNQLLMSDKEDVTPHRVPKITRTTADMKLNTQEDGKGLISLPVPKGTPVAHFASVNPHAPLYSTCGDLVENKGHQFGIDLSPADKKALIEFVKTL